MVPAIGDETDDHSADGPHDQSDPHLLEKDVAQGGKIDLAGGESAHDDRRRLAADVAPHAGDDRDERDQGDHLFQRHLEQPHEVAGDHPAEEVGDQPRQAQPGDLERLVTVEQLLLAGAGHLVDVLGRLVAQNVDDVVDGDDAHQPVSIVHDRHRQQVVLLDHLGHLLLVDVGAHADDVADHDILERLARRDHEQLAQGEDADQVAVVVGDVDVEDHLHVFGLLQGGNRLADQLVLAQRENLGGHDAAGGLFAVLEQLLDLLGVLVLHDMKDLFGDFFRHVADDLDGVVVGHLLQDAGDRLLLHLLEQARGRIVFQLGEDVGGCLRVGKQVEEDALFLQVEITEQVGDIGRMDLGQGLGEIGKGAASDQLADGIEQDLEFLFRHGCTPL